MPLRVILNIHPKQYLKQGLTHCGVFAVKAILSALGKDSVQTPEKYHTSLFGRLTGFARPSTLVRTLGSHGVSATVKNGADLADNQKLDVIKHQLIVGNPVMVRIGNGYNRRDGRWNWLQWLIIGHWITVWGFDDEESVFFVYDPAVPDALDDREAPIGNKKRSYNEFLRDWSWNGIQLFLLPKYLYIAVSLKNI